MAAGVAGVVTGVGCWVVVGAAAGSSALEGVMVVVDAAAAGWLAGVAAAGVAGVATGAGVLAAGVAGWAGAAGVVVGVVGVG